MSTPKTPLTYTPEVAQLLTLGPPGGSVEAWRKAPFLNYGEMGLSAANIPELRGMMADKELSIGDEPDCFGPVHAARALVSLEGSAVFGPLVELVRWLDKMGDDVWLDDVPNLLVRMGPTIIKPVAAIARDRRETHGTRITLWNSLEDIAKQHPESRALVISVLLDALKYARLGDPGINGNAISMLVDLGAAEAIPQIEAAFDTGCIDEFSSGKRENVLKKIKMSPEEREAFRAEQMQAILKRFEQLTAAGNLRLDDPGDFIVGFDDLDDHPGPGKPLLIIDEER